MKVLIVARTIMSSNRCIGGIAENGRSLRLLNETGYCQPINSPFRVGEVWNLEIEEIENKKAPHLEDVKVLSSERICENENVAKFIEPRIEIIKGGIHNLFSRFLRFTQNDNGYISEITGVPDFSTCFWMPDKNLLLRSDRKHFDYNMVCGFISINKGLKYVGEEQLVESIPANTLVRVSLARWWHPPDIEIEDRCYLQLSGWF